MNTDWDTFITDATLFQTLVEAVFINNDTEWNQISITSFEKMSPGVKMYSRMYASLGLLNIAHKAGDEGKGLKTSCYTSQLDKKIAEGTAEGEKYTDSIVQGFSGLIDAYMAIN